MEKEGCSAQLALAWEAQISLVNELLKMLEQGGCHPSSRSWESIVSHDSHTALAVGEVLASGWVRVLKYSTFCATMCLMLSGGTTMHIESPVEVSEKARLGSIVADSTTSACSWD